MGSFSWCTELQKLEGNPLCPGTLLTKPPPVSGLVRVLNVAVSALGQEQGSRPRNYGNKPKKQGHCRHIDLKDCNLLKGGEGCRRNTRLTAHCPFRLYFAHRKDGTVSTKLINSTRLRLLYVLREREMRELTYA